jgi:putative endonuclease
MSLLNKIFAKKQVAKEAQHAATANPKKDNTKTGQLGESLAQDYLKKKGYDIIDVNYKTKFAEIDLITQFKDILVFVEVRTRVGEDFGIPEQSLIRKKVNKVIKNAQMYMKYKHYSGRHRIDAVCVVLDKNKNLLRLNHYENITM